MMTLVRKPEGHGKDVIAKRLVQTLRRRLSAARFLASTGLCQSGCRTDTKLPPDSPDGPRGLQGHQKAGLFAAQWPAAIAGAPSVVEFLSHKWRYLARVFYVDSYGDGPFQASYAIVLERGHHVTTELAQISAQYGLTNREKETMRLLVDGLTSKELASRMKISPNTVKVFLRLIMMKMGLPTRAGIIGKIVSRQ